jgi:FMN phosphatase YigB (HAD superfamily)
VRPDEAIYVGDDAQVDGLAANRAAVPFVWFNPKQTALDAKVTVHYQVTHLSHLRAVL